MSKKQEFPQLKVLNVVDLGLLIINSGSGGTSPVHGD